MYAEAIEKTRWLKLPIACPECGNHGEPNGRWITNAPVPFKLIEEVVRSFMFSAELDQNGRLDLLADVETDSVDWESAHNLRFECMACFAEFAIPESVTVDFD